MLQSRYYMPTKPEEKKRITDYLYYESLYLGQNKNAFHFKKGLKSDSAYLLNNYVRLLSEFFSDLLFSESPEFISDTNQDELDDFVKENKLHMLNMQSSISNSYRGDAVYKLWRDEDNDVHVQEVPPMMYFPKYKNDMIDDLESVTLAWIVCVDDKKYVQKEIHYPDRIENELYLLVDENNTKGEYVGSNEVRVPLSTIGSTLPDSYVNPIGEILVVHIPNYKISNNAFGISDIQSLDTLLSEADYRMSQLANILDKHADPKLAVPPGVLDKHGNIASGSLEMFQVSANTAGLNKPEYITWDAQLEYVFKEIDLITERIALFGRMPLGLMKQGSEGYSAPEAAKALKLKFLMSLKKASRKQVYYDIGLKKVFDLAGQLSGNDWSSVYIKWNDGLPEDRLEEIQIIQAEKAAGIKSAEQAAREHMHKKGMDEQAINEEIARMQQEQDASGAGLPSSKPVVDLPVKA